MVVTAYKCDFCGKEYKENKVKSYVVGQYDRVQYSNGCSENKFKPKDMCDECRKKLMECIVNLCKDERGVTL